MKVCMLPKYGEENPYQVLTIEGLREEGIDAFFGVRVKFFPILYNYFKFKPNWIHIDWIYFAYQVNLPLPFKWLFYYIFNFQLFFIKKLTNCRIGYTFHNFDSHEKYHNKINLLAQKSIINYADFIRVFSIATKRKIKKKWDFVDLKKLIYQPEGSYINYYPNSISLKEAREQLQLNKDDFVILFLGSIRKYKGVIELIESFNSCKEKNWKLVIAGYRYDKEYCDLIERKTESDENIKLFFGHQKNEDLQLYFNASDVVALPFKKIENSGSVILAMGFSKPILAPAIGVLKEKLKHQNSIMFTENIEESLLKIKDMNSNVLKEIGIKNFDVARKYSWRDFAKLFY